MSMSNVFGLVLLWGLFIGLIIVIFLASFGVLQ